MGDERWDNRRDGLPCVIRAMRILFGIILTVLRDRRINENMVWTDSQDLGADEILNTIRTMLFNKIVG